MSFSQTLLKTTASYSYDSFKIDDKVKGTLKKINDVCIQSNMKFSAQLNSENSFVKIGNVSENNLVNM